LRGGQFNRHLQKSQENTKIIFVSLKFIVCILLMNKAREFASQAFRCPYGN